MPASSLTATQVLPDEAIHNLLVRLIDIERQSTGVAVGVVDETGARSLCYGSFSHSDPRPIVAHSLFEIASVTKAFTALLLLDAVTRNEVQLHSDLRTVLGGNVQVPSHNGHSITLLDLATHTSGLPRIPTNLCPVDPENPYAAYTERDLLDFLSSFQLEHEVGSHFEYSNLGFGLLGFALSKPLGSGYEGLLRSRILEPLQLGETSVTVPPDRQAGLAPGHTRDLRSAKPWDPGILAGAGGLRSTAHDLLTFLSAQLGYATIGSLARPMSAVLSVTRPTGRNGLSAALG